MERVEYYLGNISLFFNTVLVGFILGFGLSYNSSVLYDSYTFLLKCYAHLFTIITPTSQSLTIEMIHFLHHLQFDITTYNLTRISPIFLGITTLSIWLLLRTLVISILAYSKDS